MIQFLSSRYKGYEVCFGCSNENVGIPLLSSLGFEKMEESFAFRWHRENSFMKKTIEGCKKITIEFFKDFAFLHSLYEDDMFYTTEKIKDSFSNWIIHGYYHNGKIEAVIYAYKHKNLMIEIYGLDFKDKIYKKEIAKKLLIAIKEEENLPIFCLAEKDEKEAFEESEFSYIDCYQCYLKKI